MNIWHQSIQSVVGIFLFMLPIAAFAAEEDSKMTLVTCWQKQDDMLASVFMLPPDWQATCQSEYFQNVQGWVSASSLYEATGPNGHYSLANFPTQHFTFDPQMIQLWEGMLDQDRISFGSPLPETLQMYQQTLANYPPPVDLEQYTREELRIFLEQDGYVVKSINDDDALAELLMIRAVKEFGVEIKALVQINVIIMTAQQQNQPEQFSLIKIVQAIVNNGPLQEWSLSFYGAEGGQNDAMEMSQLVDLIISTEQLNPVFEVALARTNIALSKLRMQAGEAIARAAKIMHDTFTAVNDQMMASYSERQQSNERISRAMLDAINEIETYTDPYTGKLVSMPSENEYYFTNNLDDYIGSNNPLFDPNIELTTLYNWQRLERVK